MKPRLGWGVSLSIRGERLALIDVSLVFLWALVFNQNASLVPLLLLLSQDKLPGVSPERLRRRQAQAETHTLRGVRRIHLSMSKTVCVCAASVMRRRRRAFHLLSLLLD